MDLIYFDTSKSLEDLEKIIKDDRDWKVATVFKGHKLRKKPIRDFSEEELRLTISQNIGLKFLVPLAIERLLKDPLIKGEGYAGDLMNAVLTVEKRFWTAELKSYIPLLETVIEKALATVKSNPEDYQTYMQRSAHAIKLFQDNTAGL